MSKSLPDDLSRLLARLDSLTDDDLWMLEDMWQREDGEARRAAWVRVKSAIADSTAADALDEARAAVTAWMRAGPGDYKGIGGLLGRPSAMFGARQGAAPALIDAAAAMVAAEKIDETDIAVLVRSWQALDDMDEGDHSG